MRHRNNFYPSASVLTAGRDRHYSLGLAMALVGAGVKFDFIGSDELESKELEQSPQVRFLNLRGEQGVNTSFLKKIRRIIAYYCRLFLYAMRSRAKVFHILWNNKFELFDRTLMMVFYKCLGKKITFTAHNVNAGRRDGCDSFLNRASLRFQYRLCDRIFVHTQKMENELISDFAVPKDKIVMVPFGINDAVPVTSLSGAEARKQLGLRPDGKVILFFGNIAPYKGLEFLLDAFTAILKEDSSARLIIAGRPKGPKSYWEQMLQTISRDGLRDKVMTRIEYIADSEIEVFFKAADILVLPYLTIFQSGVLFLAYSFGLPVIATDVGSLKEEIIEGRTGYVCQPQNPQALASAIKIYFQSDLYNTLESRRAEIQHFAKQKYSWAKVGAITAGTYSKLLHERTHSSALMQTGKNDESFSFNIDSSL